MSFQLDIREETDIQILHPAESRPDKLAAHLFFSPVRCDEEKGNRRLIAKSKRPPEPSERAEIYLDCESPTGSRFGEKSPLVHLSAAQSETVNADRAAATARLVDDRQACRAMLVEFPAGFFDRFVCATTGRRWPHDLVDANFGSAAVFRRRAATDVALRDDADQLEIVCAFDNGRAAAD